MPSLYETDFSRWADKTAKLLAEKRFSELDLDELIEEVQDLAGRHRDASLASDYRASAEVDVCPRPYL